MNTTNRVTNPVSIIRQHLFSRENTFEEVAFLSSDEYRFIRNLNAVLPYVNSTNLTVSRLKEESQKRCLRIPTLGTAVRVRMTDLGIIQPTIGYGPKGNYSVGAFRCNRDFVEECTLLINEIEHHRNTDRTKINKLKPSYEEIRLWLELGNCFLAKGKPLIREKAALIGGDGKLFVDKWSIWFKELE